MIRTRWIARVFLLAAGWIGSGSLLPAGEPLRLTLADCLRIGIERSTDLQRARREQAMAETVIGQTGAQAYPQVTASASYRRLEEVPTMELFGFSVDTGDVDNFSAGVTVRQLLYSGGSISAALQAARYYRDLQAHRYARARAELVRDIHTAFADILWLEMTLEVHDQAIQLLHDMVTQTEKRYRREMASEFDVLGARVQWQSAQPDRIRAENDIALAKEAFRNLLNLDERDFVLSGTLEYEPFTTPWDVLLERARRQRPELRIMEQQILLAGEDLRVERAAYRPSLHATFDYRGDNPAPGLVASEGWEWGWFAGLQASWTLLDGGMRRNRVLQKQLERQQAETALAQLHRAVEFEVRQAYRRIEHAAQVLAAARAHIDLAGKSMEIAETRYANGLITRLEYADANLALTRARLNEAQALRAHGQAVHTLRYAVGDFLEAGYGKDNGTYR